MSKKYDATFEKVLGKRGLINSNEKRVKIKEKVEANSFSEARNKLRTKHGYEIKNIEVVEDIGE